MGIRKTINLKGKNLDFDEPSHTYTYTFPDGEQKVMTSGTTLLKPYFPFDTMGVILGNSLKWLKESVFTKLELGLTPYKFVNIWRWMENPTSPFWGKSPSEIQEMWNAKAQFGTDVHQFCEDYLNGEFVTVENDRMMKALGYMQKMSFDDVLTEVQVVAPSWGISGMIDCLVQKNGKWYILDWKTDKAIRKKAYKKEDKCNGVLASFDNCNYNKFCFQLGVYRFILDMFYDIDIHGITVVHIPENGPVKEYDLPYHIEYIGMLVKKHLEGNNENNI